MTKMQSSRVCEVIFILREYEGRKRHFCEIFISCIYKTQKKNVENCHSDGLPANIIMSHLMWRQLYSNFEKKIRKASC